MVVLTSLRQGLDKLDLPAQGTAHRTLPSMNQLRPLLLKPISLDASDYSGRLPLRFPPACHSCPLAPILFILLPPSSAIFAFLLARDYSPSVQSCI
jgi:hypothetical protein